MIDEVLVVLVRAMVERFESKGVVDIPVEYRQQSKSKRVSVVWYIAKTMNTKLNSKYRRYFHASRQTGLVARQWLRIVRHVPGCT